VNAPARPATLVRPRSWRLDRSVPALDRRPPTWGSLPGKSFNRTMAVLSSPRQEQQLLLARYRRVLSVGDVLDESIQLFRQRWTSFAIVSAVAFLPPGLMSVWFSASGALGGTFSLAEIQSGRLAQRASLADEGPAVFGAAIVSLLAFLLWSPAVVVATDVYQRGGEPRLRVVYTTALRRYWAVLLA